MKMKVADYIIKRLEEAGIRECFVVYGAANGDLIDAFTRMEKIRYICTIHEQGAGFMAEGYAKASGNFGVAIATSGPGGQNFVTSIANCYYDSVPCLFITGQVKTQFMRQADSKIRQIGFQETPIVEIVSPIVKYAKCITKPEEVQWSLEYALHKMKSGRQGPVLLDVPIDVQKAEVEINENYSLYSSSSSSSEENLHKAFDRLKADLKNSKRPYILVGGGTGHCRELIEHLVECFNIPVSPTWNAIDIITSDMKNYAGRVGTYGGDGRNFGIQNCDLLICFGTRISGRITGGKPETFARESKKWVIDIDHHNKKQMESQGIKVDEFICEGVYHFLKEFIRSYEKETPPEDKVKAGRFDDWMKQCVQWRDKYDPINLHFNFMNLLEKGVNPYLFMRQLSQACGKHDVIVSDCGGNQVIFAHAFQTKRGQRCFTNNGNSPMGFSMCGAIGAWFATSKKEERNIICIIGDGGMQMNIQELQTIFNYNVNIKIFIINNGIYGITKAYQKVNFEGRAEACESPHYTCPDFRAVVHAYGVNYVRIDNPFKVKEILNADLNQGYPIIFDVVCPDWHSYYPKISGWKTPIEDMEPYLPRDEFQGNMIINPLPGWKNHDYS